MYNPNPQNLLTLAFIFSGGPNSSNDPSAIVPVSSAQAQDNSTSTVPPASDNAGVPAMLPLPRGSTRPAAYPMAQL